MALCAVHGVAASLPAVAHSSASTLALPEASVLPVPLALQPVPNRSLAQEETPFTPELIPNELCAVRGYWRYPMAGDLDVGQKPVESCDATCDEVCPLTASERNARFRSGCKSRTKNRGAWAVWIAGVCCPANQSTDKCYSGGVEATQVVLANRKYRCKVQRCDCSPQASTSRACDWELLSSTPIAAWTGVHRDSDDCDETEITSCGVTTTGTPIE